MWDPFSILRFLYSVAKDAPDPVNVQFDEPSPNLMPNELRKKTKTAGFFVSQLWVDNLSKNVLNEVRINLTAPLEYEPIVRTNKRHGEIDYTYDSTKLELNISRIDPSESLKISFFPKLGSLNQFKEPQIIVGTKELGTIMAQLGFYKKYPSILASYIFASTMVLFAIMALLFLSYVLFRDNEYLFPESKYTVSRQAQERLSKYGCPMLVEANTEELRTKLSSGPPYHLPTILEMNGVFSAVELWKKPNIAYIDCKSLAQQSERQSVDSNTRNVIVKARQ
mgnify:CR=1 FL=1